MVDSFVSNSERIFCLNEDCVIELHDILSNNVHLLEDMDPVEPRGVKNLGMLESAVNRQISGLGDYYKYNTWYSNAATLVFGVIKNHAFHNGNKRAGFLALIKHLYINGYVLRPDLSSEEIYEFLIAIADSKIFEFSLKHRKKYSFILSKEEKRIKDWSLDTQIRFISYWIKKNGAPKSCTIKGEVKISVLKKVLNNKGIKIEQSGSNLDVFVEGESKFLGIKFGVKIIKKKSYSLGNKRTDVIKPVLISIRKDFNLTKSDGVDDTFFYDENAFLDSEIKAYKRIIYRLSKT